MNVIVKDHVYSLIEIYSMARSEEYILITKINSLGSSLGLNLDSVGSLKRIQDKAVETLLKLMVEYTLPYKDYEDKIELEQLARQTLVDMTYGETIKSPEEIYEGVNDVLHKYIFKL